MKWDDWWKHTSRKWIMASLLGWWHKFHLSFHCPLKTLIKIFSMHSLFLLESNNFSCFFFFSGKVCETIYNNVVPEKVCSSARFWEGSLRRAAQFVFGATIVIRGCIGTGRLESNASLLHMTAFASMFCFGPESHFVKISWFMSRPVIWTDLNRHKLWIWLIENRQWKWKWMWEQVRVREKQSFLRYADLS